MKTMLPKLVVSSLSLILLLMAANPAAAAPGLQQQIPAAEYNALIDLYNSTQGGDWVHQDGWLDPTASSWFGVSVSGFQYDSGTSQIISRGTVTELSLFANQLSGSIPTSFGNLVNLQILYLNDNALTGNIPDSFGNLVNLQILALNGNQLSGSIPSSLGNLVNLQTLYLYNNQLSGSIPDSFANLASLQTLSLYGNQLSGSIPSVLGNLLNLQVLGLADNQLSGSIPDGLGKLVNLIGLYLSDNKLTGNIPDSLGNLVNLQTISLYGDQLSGSIPSVLGNLVKLQTLYLSANQLSGNIPDSLGDLVNLQILTLNGNHLSGNIPDSLGNLANLQGLYLSDNRLTGNLPTGLVNLANLSTVSLDLNCFDISAGSQPRTVIDHLAQAGKTVNYQPQNTDCEPVGLTCPADLTVPADAGKCSAIVNYPPPTTSATATVVCVPPSGSVFPVGATIVNCTATAANGAKASCAFTVHVQDLDPPKVTCLEAIKTLRIPNHLLTLVGFFARAGDNCSGPIAASRIKVQVFSDEDELAPSSGNFSPDAKNLTATGTLQLRAERRGDADGRVYLIVAKATDSSGNTGFSTCTVTVPHDQSAKSIASVAKQAVAAQAYAASHNGAPPPGYFVIGNGPNVGPNPGSGGHDGEGSGGQNGQGSDGRGGKESDGRSGEKSVRHPGEKSF